MASKSCIEPAKDLLVDAMVERGAKSELQGVSTKRLEFYAEHLDDSRFPGEGCFTLFREYLREKYRQQHPD